MLRSALAVFFLTRDFATVFPRREVLRDSTATVIATGTGMRKRLITNGVGITSLTPVTKMMAHLTLASLPEPPHNVLVICFGMGTTYRSVMSWGVRTTAVELVPSVPRLFSYYHEDGAHLLDSPRSHLVIDDGRRYMERSPQKFDAIIIDPPPPVQAAASSLLYSKGFYAVAKERLEPDGILQQWLPDGDSGGAGRGGKGSEGFIRLCACLSFGGRLGLALPRQHASDSRTKRDRNGSADACERSG